MSEAQFSFLFRIRVFLRRQTSLSTRFSEEGEVEREREREKIYTHGRRGEQGGRTRQLFFKVKMLI